MLLVEGSFRGVWQMLGMALREAPEVHVPEWQSMDVKDKPMGITHELQNVDINVPIPGTQRELEVSIPTGNYPWAENHFQERVSGIPYNPPPSAAEWPFAQGGHKDHTEGGMFSHTYPERFWPKEAEPDRRLGKNLKPAMTGIRFDYGDLQDVVTQLAESPMTRQAYLPVWFPEDTGAVHGERVPCSLGYHFLIREGRLNVTYFIRSVDFLRHFSDDVYMAARLGQWVRDELHEIGHEDFFAVLGDSNLYMGNLTMHMVSLHVFGGDMARMEREFNESRR